MTRRAPAPLARVLHAGAVTLVAYDGTEAPVLASVVGANLAHLGPWMPWAQRAPTVAEEEEVVARFRAQWDAGTAYAYWLREEGTGELVGGAGLHARVGEGGLEIGYWVRADRIRRGYATATARALTTAAFGVEGIVRVEIHCDETNLASARVPARLGYRLARVAASPREAPGESGREMVWVMDAETWASIVTASS